MKGKTDNLKRAVEITTKVVKVILWVKLTRELIKELQE